MKEDQSRAERVRFQMFSARRTEDLSERHSMNLKIKYCSHSDCWLFFRKNETIYSNKHGNQCRHKLSFLSGTSEP